MKSRDIRGNRLTPYIFAVETKLAFTHCLLDIFGSV